MPSEPSDREPRVTRDGAQEALLRRELGWIAATAIVINSTIGTGIFQRPAAVVREAGSLELAALVWVVGAVIALCGALSVAELSVRFPRAGGLYEPLRQTYGAHTGFVFGWAQIALLAPSAVGSFCLLAGGALGALLGWPEGTEKPLSLAVLVLVLGSALVGTKLGAAQQTAITSLKYAGVITLGLVGLFATFDPPAPVALVAGVTVRTEGSVVGFLAALIAAMWAYDGWADLTALAGEVKDPQRTLPRALVLGTMLVALAYLGVVLGDARVLGLSGLRSSGSGSAMAAMRVAEATSGPPGRTALSLLVAISATGGAMASMMTHSRAFLPMATDGTFFRGLGVVSATGVPVRALLVMGGLAALYLLSGTFESLTDAFVVGYFPFYALAVLSVFRWRREPSVGFLAPLHPLPALLFLLGAAMVIVGSLLDVGPSTALAFGVLALGIPISLAYRRLRR